MPRHVRRIALPPPSPNPAPKAEAAPSPSGTPNPAQAPSPKPEPPRTNQQFAVTDFIQEPQHNPGPADHAHTPCPEHEAEPTDCEPFSWFQDAIEQENEDIAAWGSTAESDEPFVWYSDPDRVASPRKTRPTPAPASVGPATSPTEPPTHFRPEIEGLRAVAVLMIVMYHVWLGRVSGGVDVFLFISAFLLGSSFARRLDARGSFTPVRYWLRTFTRLMPPAVLTIVATLMGARLLLAPSAWQSVIEQAMASAAYVQNIVLSNNAVDYYALDASTASPLQHFWSLSLQGQVFLVWPLLFVAIAWLARRSAHPRRLAFGVFAIIFAASLAYSVWFTTQNQAGAYFSTPARAWEVSAGTLLALALPRLDHLLGAQRPGDTTAPGLRTLRALAGWTGFTILVLVGLVLDVQGQFPGWIAGVPLVGAALIIMAGYSGSRWGFDRILTLRLPRALATISYCLYLVHWPLLIFWLATSHKPRAGLWDGLAVIAVSLVTAWVLSVVVDAQFRSSVWKSAPALRSLLVMGLCLALVFGSALGWRASLDKPEETPEEVKVQVKAPVEVDDSLSLDELVPKGYELKKQWPSQKYKCAGPFAPPRSFRRTHCDMRLPADAKPNRVVVIVGSSHSRMFIPALEAAAKRGNWQIVNLAMDGCWYTRGVREGLYCEGYGQWALDSIAHIKPDLVLTVGTSAQPDSGDETVTPGIPQGISDIVKLGIPVLTVRDTPRWEKSPYECGEAVAKDGGNREDANTECGAPIREKLSAQAADDFRKLASLSSDQAKVVPVDFTTEVCPNGTCGPIVGNVFVYMDDNHLTKAFSSTLREQMETIIARDYPELVDGSSR